MSPRLKPLHAALGLVVFSHPTFLLIGTSVLISTQITGVSFLYRSKPVLLLASSVVFAASAQPPAPAAPNIRVDATLVLVPVTVTDARGSNVQGLGKDSFTVLDDRRKAWGLLYVDPQPVFGENGEVFAFINLAFERNAKQGDPAQLVCSGTVSAAVEVPFVLRDVPVAKG